MRFSVFAAVAALGSTAFAQSIPGLPACAATCFGNNLGNCGQVDIACICGNTAVINSVSCCVFATCSQADTQTTINFAVSLCKAQGVNVNTSPSCPASGSASASASASGSASLASSAASAASSVSGNMTAMVSGVTGSASRTSTPTGGASGAASTGAAPLPTAAGYGIGLAGMLAGMLAAL